VIAVSRAHRRAARVLALIASLGTAAGCAGRGAEPGSPPPSGEPVVALVSIGGFTPAALDPGADGEPLLPTAAAFAARGARADRVTPVVPAATYPAHATLVTGARPVTHGMVANRRLGEHGVARRPTTQASVLRVPAIWQAANQNGIRVAGLDWPSTRGAPISLLIPDTASRSTATWLEALRDLTPTSLLALAAEHGAGEAAAARPGAARDAVLVDVACELVKLPKRPRLVLLHLSQAEAALAEHGPQTPEAVEAFAGADAELARWLGCLRSVDLLESATVMLVGDIGYGSVHTAIAPNVTLQAERLIMPAGAAIDSWEAIARSNGGSAFVYARGERAAVRARDALARAAQASGAFRVLSADEMISAGADPEAWFGLEAEPGFLFVDDASGELLRPAAVRGAGGYVVAGSAFDPGFAAWGRGIRRGIRIPVMRQTDVAPTLARLLGLTLEQAEGRALVGVLEADAATGGDARAR
jgi:hypothetical protein